MRTQAPKGTYDVLPKDQARVRRLEEVTRSVVARAGVQPITTPIIEHAETFERSAGEGSDLVVQKEMYTFVDRGGRSLTLRPELTAGVLRAFIEHGMHTLPMPVKLFSAGPAFRAENVQRGRFRQFHQLNLEIVGSDAPLADAEAVALLWDVLQAIGLAKVSLRVGSVGDVADRERYNAYVRESLAGLEDRLSPTSRDRLRLNPLRLLDSKDEGDRELLRSLARPLDFLGDASRAHFDAVLRSLRAWDVPFEIDPAIVRGLDYYRRTAFEVHSGSIGAQSALGGGGRYDGLVAQLGGPDVPGVGWALGVERILDALAEEGAADAPATRPIAFLVPLDDDAVEPLAGAARGLRDEFHVEHAYARRAPGKGLRDADRAGAVFAVLMGADERSRDAVTVKHLASGDQREVALTDLRAFLRAHAAAAVGPAADDGGSREAVRASTHA